MHIGPSSDPIFDFDEDISLNKISTSLNKNDTSLSFKENSGINSREFVQLYSDYSDVKSSICDQIMIINKFIIFDKIIDGKLTVTPLHEFSSEEVEQALADDKLGMLEAAENGSVVVKFSKQRTAELESVGVNSVEVRDHIGTVRIYTFFKFQTLSDTELNLLITQTKTYIVFLKTKGDQGNETTGKKLFDLERKNLYLKLERAIRTNHPELKYLLEGLLKTSPYKIAIRMVEIWNHQKAIEEKREQEKIQKTLEIKHIIILEEISKLELHKIIIKDEVVENDFNSEGLTKKNVNQENSRRITHVNRFICIYNGLNT